MSIKFKTGFDTDMIKILIKDRTLDIEELESSLLYDLENDNTYLDNLYDYADKCNPSFREKIDEVASKSNNLNAIRYITLNNLEPKKVFDIFVSSIGNVMIDDQDVIDIVNDFKKSMITKNLFDDSVEAIKHSNDREAIITSALIFDNSLIKEFFGSKEDLYLYLISDPSENDNLYIEFLLSMNNNELEKSAKSRVKNIDNKINNY